MVRKLVMYNFDKIIIEHSKTKDFVADKTGQQIIEQMPLIENQTTQTYQLNRPSRTKRQQTDSIPIKSDRQTNGRTARPSNRDPRTHLKNE